MGKWNNFYLRRMGTDENSSPYNTYESVTTWGIWCKSIPFKLYDKVKEPAKRSWYDEHGDDEFLPDGGLFMDAYTMDVEFGCKIIKTEHDRTIFGKAVSDVRANVGEFIEYLRTSGMMMMYSSYSRIGRQKVRLSEIHDDAVWKSDDDQEFLIFKVTFKVNDPMTNIILTDSQLEPDE